MGAPLCQNSESEQSQQGAVSVTGRCENRINNTFVINDAEQNNHQKHYNGTSYLKENKYPLNPFSVKGCAILSG